MATQEIQFLLAELKACSRTRDLRRGRDVHAEVVACGHATNIYIASALTNMYAKCGSMAEARQIFDTIQFPNVVAWTALILGYAVNGQGRTALSLFRSMRNAGVSPDSVTFVAALKACASLAEKQGPVECRMWGKEIHDHIVKSGCDSDICVQSSLIEMYAKCGSMPDARQIFNSLKKPDVVSWTALMLGYAENGEGFTALDMFRKMEVEGLEPDSVAFVAALKACTTLAEKEGRKGWGETRGRGRMVHGLAVRDGCDTDNKVRTTLIDMYANCGSLADARKVFDSMKLPDVASWNALILGYADTGQGLCALELLVRMRNEGPVADTVTYIAALKACGLVGALGFGKRIHSEIDNIDEVLLTCLVDFYAKCGDLVEAKGIFDLHAETKNVRTWTALLAGFSSCGDHRSALELFEAMQKAGLVPSSVSFQCILACCSHAGLVEQGKEYFDAMPRKYGIVPSLEHYTCMVDILGRANKLDDAMALLQLMPCSPDDVTWRSVLGACRKRGNVELGTLAFQCLVSFGDDEEAAYVLMGLIYGSRGMLREQAMVMEMRSRKKPGAACWTDELGEVHSFLGLGLKPSLSLANLRVLC